ncbi:hypothetical protein FQZ97_862840 [compost metagenome]
MPAGGRGRPRAGNAQGRDAGADHGQPGPPVDRRRPGDRRGGARQHRAPYRRHARQGPPRPPGRSQRRTGRQLPQRHFRAADADRAGQHRGTEARGVRPGAACGALPARGARHHGQPDQRHQLWPDAGHPYPHRRDHLVYRQPRPCGQPVREPQYRRCRGRRAAVRRRGAVGHRSQGGRPAVPAPAAVGVPAGRGGTQRAGGRRDQPCRDGRPGRRSRARRRSLPQLGRHRAARGRGRLRPLCRGIAVWPGGDAGRPHRRAQHLHAAAARTRAVPGRAGGRPGAAARRRADRRRVRRMAGKPCCAGAVCAPA